MNKIICMRGLPGSGKTTRAKEMMAESPGKYKRVNKDDLRDMIDAGTWSKKNEKMILDVRDSIVDLALAEGYNVIVDDTNLEFKHIERMFDIADLHETEVEMIDMEADLEFCIENDKKRPNSIGEKIMRRMYRQYYGADAPKHNPELPDAIMCDIDGTLAHMVGRSPYDYPEAINDIVDENVLQILMSYKANGNEIIMMTGRDEECEDVTVAWLEKNNVPYDYLFMRKNGDKRKDCIAKQELYEENVLGKFNVKLNIDDRQQMVDMWRNLGLKTFQVADGLF